MEDKQIHEARWYAWPERDASCLDANWMLRGIAPSVDGALCLTFFDGPRDTASCTISYRAEPTTGALEPGCNAQLPSGAEVQRSPTGRYTLQWGQEVAGDNSYYTSATLTDTQRGRTRTFEALLMPLDNASVQWLPSEQGLVLAGKLVGLPDFELRAQGDQACALQTSR